MLDFDYAKISVILSGTISLTTYQIIMRKILKFQHCHILILLTMLIILFYVINFDANLLDVEYFKIDTKTWLIVSIIIPVAHQFYVLICWRTELFYKGLSKIFGNTDKAFKVFKINIC